MTCEHDFIPVSLAIHPNDTRKKIVWLVCRKCFVHEARFSKYRTD